MRRYRRSRLHLESNIRWVFVATREYIILLFFRGSRLSFCKYGAFTVLRPTFQVLAHLDMVFGRLSFVPSIYILSYFVLLISCLFPICMGRGVRAERVLCHLFQFSVLLREQLLWVISGYRLSIFYFLSRIHNLINDNSGAPVNLGLISRVEQNFCVIVFF